MVDLGPGQRAIVMPHYPHMMTEDRSVWTKFLESKYVELKRVWYDVHIGVPTNLPETTEETLRKIARGVSRKRIDSVCHVGGGLWVVEVKPYASMYAVGQVLSYARLFVKEYNTPGAVVPVIICDDYDEDLVDVYDEFGVLVLKND